MAVLGRLLVGSGERLDLGDLLSLDSYTAADFKYLIQSFIGASKPYVLYGLDVISPQEAIDTQNVSIRVANSVVYFPGSKAGSFYYGLEEGNINAQPLIPQLRKNATNFVYLTFSTFDTAKDSRAFWDPDQSGGAGGEFSQDVNTETALKLEVNVSVSTFPENTIPICKVVVGASVITSIQDCRDQFFRLGTGGIAPDPFSTYSFREDPSSTYSRLEPSTTMTSALNPNPFQGGDKNIRTLKEWMDVVMTRIKELGGSTYWYEGNSVAGPNINNVFLDALGSTIKSKGEWRHSGLVAGEATWTEDIHYYSLVDSRDLIVRRDTITLPSSDKVAWINVNREVDFNGIAATVDWQSGVNYVNGAVGAFANLSVGDWVKKSSDSSTLFLRVEQLNAGMSLSGTSTTAALAQSIALSGNYAGATGAEVGKYTQGEYVLTDINITDRNDPLVAAAGGNFFWLAYRTDTSLGLSSAVSTTLALTITEADGERAKVASAGPHGLVDHDHIYIDSGPYIGTYIVEYESSTVFSIKTTVTGDSSGNGHYGIVTTAARSTSYGYALETANHGFKSGEQVFIAGASPWDGSYTVSYRTATTFQIAIPSGLATTGPVTGEIVNLARLNVRTEFGTVKVVQGETANIGDMDSKNLLSFIGMDSLAETSPNYSIPGAYNALNGHQNYNSLVTDSLTTRVSRLTAMMADRVQDRGMQIVGRTNITSVTSGANQNVSALANLTLKRPGSPDQTINLTSVVSIPANSVAVIDVDRDGSTTLVPTIESWGSNYLIAENKIILFYRFADTTVRDWHGNQIRPYGHINTELPEDSQNRNVTVFNPGTVKLDISTGLLTLDVKRAAEISQVTTLAGSLVPQSSYFEFTAANDITEYYAWYNVNGAGIDPAVVGKTGVMVAILSTDTDTVVAAATVSAINTIAGADVTAGNVGALVTITNDIVGPAGDTVDGTTATTFMIATTQQGFDPDIEILIPGSSSNVIDVDTINGLGTLLLPDDYSVWVRINRFAVKTFNTIQLADASDTGTGSLYVTATASVPIDQDVIVLWSRVDNNVLVTTHEAKDPKANVYEEYLDVIVGIPSNDNEIQGPVLSGVVIQLPLDSRDSNAIQEYVVGSGQLEVFLNGQYLRLGDDWDEVGTAGAMSRRIEIGQDLAISDVLTFRIDAHGAVYFAASSSGGGSTLQDAYDSGRFIATGAGQPIVITGPAGKLMSIQGDLEVTGVIDPQGITFSQEASDPLLATDYGLWRNASDELIYKRGVSTAVNLSTDFVRRDGSSPLLADLDLNTFKVVNLGAPVSANDATRKTYVDSNFLKLSGANSMAAALNFGGFKGTAAAEPTAATDLATKNYVDNSSKVLLTNNTGSTLAAGTVVYLTATSNQIAAASAAVFSTSKGTVGVVVSDIIDSASGYIQVTGRATVLGTLVAGEVAYLSATTGQATTTPPTTTGYSLVALGVALSTTEIDINVRFIQTLDNAYDESYTLVSGPPSGSYELTGPKAPADSITLPVDSRNGGAARNYIVGSGVLQVYLNGDKLRIGDDWSEIGAPGSLSTSILTNIVIAVEDFLTFVIQLGGSTVLAGVGGGSGETNTASNLGAGAQVFKQKVGVDLQMRTLTATSGLSITQNASTVSLATKLTTRVISTTDTLTTTDDLILVDASSGAVTLNLPTAASVPGKVYYVKKTDASVNSVIVDPNGSEMIDGSLTKTSTIQYEAFTFVSDATQWWLI